MNLILPMLTTAENREIVAIDPLSLYLNGACGRAPASSPRMAFATYFASWMAPCATPGTPSSAARSPITNTSGCPGRVRSGCTFTRPARSVSAPVCSASIAPSGFAATPAAHTLHTDSTRSVEPSLRLTVKPCESTSVTIASVQISTPRLSSDLRADPPSASPKLGSTSGPPSMRMTRACFGSIRRNSPTRVFDASSRICPAISTPVGPAPTTANVRNRDRSSPSGASSASSNAPKIRARSSSASSMVFMPGAWRAK